MARRKTSTDAPPESANGGGDPAAPAAVPPAPGDATLVKPEAAPRPRLVVTALADRRRRVGHDFGRAETDLDPEALGEAGFRALVLDPLLRVELVLRSGGRVAITTFPLSEAVRAQLDAQAP